MKTKIIWLAPSCLMVLSLVLASCAPAATPTPTPTPIPTPTPKPTPTPTRTLYTFTWGPQSPANLVVGSTQQFTATGTYFDGPNEDITSQITWASSNASVATISSTGLATGVAPGMTNITASISGVTSPPVTLKVVAPRPKLSSIVVAPASPANLVVGSTQQFTATGNYSDGSNMDITSAMVTWASSDASIATISSSGLATGVASGNTKITASISGVTSPPVTLTVVEP